MLDCTGVSLDSTRAFADRGRDTMAAPLGIGNTKPLFTRVFSTDRVRTPVPPCRLVPAPGVGPHAQRRTPWRAHRQGVQGVP